MSRILFVCLGNICRSPTLEAVARVEFARAGLDVEVDSAGTADYHTGQPPDRRSIAAGAAHGYDLSVLRARQIVSADFTRFDRILAADRANLRDLERLRPERGAQPALFLGGAEVPDPYYGGAADFERVIALARQGMAALISQMRAAGP
ncbi:MAG: low molecular weight phosphotyrosine protein phosphatase [Dokdonella sp.]|uniref:low molecular weight protein-tyrosine-phosphatase n=1 Tax=Dokdonella sp. TaxID=2291710 RepID=UPI0025C61788|nr:low molecular weight protein-tyrosine-phosphatase [Dokdonella sp.]MBZ0224076.1 low molecular weight phosphotyrosine protein phosphatase [Dokdonella sp.]MCC7254546.1 low molecular weight phosphotyrosine protein phosphatase [Dokdonella sp.]